MCNNVLDNHNRYTLLACPAQPKVTKSTSDLLSYKQNNTLIGRSRCTANVLAREIVAFFTNFEDTSQREF